MHTLLAFSKFKVPYLQTSAEGVTQMHSVVSQMPITTMLQVMPQKFAL